jgi:hypothetical protein
MRTINCSWVVQSTLVLSMLLVGASIESIAKEGAGQKPSFKISSLKAQLFFEDKGSFSSDVSEEDEGPPYVHPTLWNTPLHDEDRSTSMLVTIEISGEAFSLPERKLEFTARYIPWEKEAGAIVVKKVLPIAMIGSAGKQVTRFNAGFWLYDTGCNPVQLTARIVGQSEPSLTKRVIKFGCGE